MNAVILVDRAGRRLKPLTDRTCPALLPVGGKPLAQHTVESLAMAGVRRAVLVVAAGNQQIEAALGNGERWGMQLEYVTRRRGETTDVVLRRASSALGSEFVAIRGDVLRSPVVPAFLAQCNSLQGSVVAARVGGQTAGMFLVRRGGASRVAGMLNDSDAPADLPGDLPTVDREGFFSAVEDLRAYHGANLAAATGRIAGLLLPGHSVGPEVRIGAASIVAEPDRITGATLIGARCRIEAGVELSGEVVIHDDVVIDRRASLSSVVVLPNTFVGQMVELRNAIVWENQLIRVDTGAVTMVPDAFLLAPLQSPPRPPVLARLGKKVGRLFKAAPEVRPVSSRIDPGPASSGTELILAS